jgi:hypothetical protein
MNRQRGTGNAERGTYLAVLALAFVASVLPAQAAPISDNSFLVEEAYNQERGVVQHINALVRARDGAWLFTFTQEWPFFSPRHQLGFTVPFVSDAQGDARVGDLFVNYRYQLVGSDGAVAAAPRVSLLLPTGRAADGSGADAWGVQVNLPVSVRLGEWAVTHWNAGATVLPRAASATGGRATLRAYNLAASAIWLARSRFNVMLEASWARAEEVVGPNTVRAGEVLLVMPGVRWAHDFRSGLQVVPGVGYAFEMTSGKSDAMVVYLSFEHGF